MFAVTTKQEELSILRTGFLGPCVAFYGINEKKGIAFMSHVDANLFGMGGLRDRLKEVAEGDLDGFSLYVTTNYTLTIRVISLILVCTSFRFVPLAGWLAALAFVVMFSFASLIQIYVFSAITFKTLCVKPRTPFQIWGRVEVTVDAASKVGPDKPRKEVISTDESKDRYGPTHCWLLGLREAMPKRDMQASDSSNN